MGKKTLKRLLLVEDQVLIPGNDFVSLEKYGYEVITAGNTDEAVEAVRKKNIDLILLDIDFGAGKFDGTGLPDSVIEESGIPVLFLLNSPDAEALKRSQRITSYGYAAKNWDAAVLDASIKTALRLFNMNRNSDSRHTEIELEKTRTMLYDVLNTIPVRVFWKDLNSVYMGCNQLFAQDSERARPEEIIGTTDYDIRDSIQAESNRIDDRNIINSGKPRINYEEPFLTREGRKNWIKTSKIPLYNSGGEMYGILGMYEDITERKQMEEELILQKNRLNNILYGSNVGTWEWNVQTGENVVNEYWAFMLGYTLDELPIDNTDFWRQFVHAEDLEKVHELLEKHFNKESDYFECEFRMLHKNGDWVWVLSRGKVSAWTKDGKPLLVSGTHQDINERKLNQNEVLHQLFEKETILKEVHHRIKNNFASICSLLSLQAESVADNEAAAVLHDAIGRVHSMQVLYEKLLQAESYQDTSLRNYLNDLVDDIVTLFSGRISVSLEKQICDCRLSAKQLFSIGIIINELITNTLKYAFDGRDTGCIRIILEENNGTATLVIHDNGNGLPDGFDINKKVGFGLMLVKIFSQQLNGDFTIENSDGAKSILKFQINDKIPSISR